MTTKVVNLKIARIIGFKAQMHFCVFSFATFVVILGGGYKMSISVEKIDIFIFRKHLKIAVFLMFFSLISHWNRRFPLAFGHVMLIFLIIFLLRLSILKLRAKFRIVFFSMIR